jgi:hypothetical protein
MPKDPLDTQTEDWVISTKQDGDDLLNEIDAAAFLCLAPSTLRKARQGRGGLVGLPFVRLGRAIRYRKSDLREFVALGWVGVAQ